MATIVKTTYRCDICGKETYVKGVMKDVSIPCRTYNYIGDEMDGFAKVDMCKECLDRYIKSVRENFADIQEMKGSVIEIRVLGKAN